jgi:hypothetical protein
MKIQLLSDLHLETEPFRPAPAPGADVLVLAGDIDASWEGFRQFVDWPVPVLVVAGNHEFDGRDIDQAWVALRAHCFRLGLRLLQRECVVLTGPDGRRVRFAGCTRWSDFDALGSERREQAMRAATYFMRIMGAQRAGQAFDAWGVREEALACRRWLAAELQSPGAGRWDATVVVTHFAPSLRSADPRYGQMASTASFCNADDDLIPLADLWLHGHLHCRQDYEVTRPDGTGTRVVCHARGLQAKGEPDGHDPMRLLEL